MDPQFGIVAVLDALGVSSYSIKEAQDFISHKDRLINEITEKLSPAIAAMHSKTVRSPDEKYDFSQMQIAVFGDTVIICWPTKNEKEAIKLLPEVCLFLRYIIASGIVHGILFRGAVSIGDYLHDRKSTILGPAISDAYSWSEEADWIGIIFTPHFRMILGHMLENEKISSGTEQWCVLYPVPLHNAIKELFAISWPAFFLSIPIEGKSLTPYGGLCKFLSSKPIPKGTESKYENTLAFFKWYEQNKHAK
jgi:hypothetical protein